MRPARRQGFSLASILLLTAVVAVIMAAMCRAWLRPGDTDPDLAAAYAIVGLVVGSAVGAGIGFSQVRQVGGTLLGMCVGLLAGAASAVLLIVPHNFPALAAGCLVVLLLAVLLRLSSDKPSQD